MIFSSTKKALLFNKMGIIHNRKSVFAVLGRMDLCLSLLLDSFTVLITSLLWVGVSQSKTKSRLLSSSPGFVQTGVAPRV